MYVAYVERAKSGPSLQEKAEVAGRGPTSTRLRAEPQFGDSAVAESTSSAGYPLSSTKRTVEANERRLPSASSFPSQRSYLAKAQVRVSAGLVELPSKS